MTSHRKTGWVRLVAVGLGVCVAAGCGMTPVSAKTTRVIPVVVGTGDVSPIIGATLEHLPVKGRAPKTGYDRSEFGPAWADTDGNGCDQRNDVLARDLDDVRHVPGSACVVAAGTLHDPYTGRTVAFLRGQSTSSAVQIDHLVSLSDAWQTGAQQLDAATRRQLANDPDNLLAVDGPTNESKGDGDAATWLPPNRAAWCDYGTRQVTIKARYRLWVTAAERDALARLLATCPTSQLSEAPR